MGFTHWDWDLATGNGMNNYKMGHSTLRTLHPESKILEMKLFFTNLSFVVFI